MDEPTGELRCGLKGGHQWSCRTRGLCFVGRKFWVVFEEAFSKVDFAATPGRLKVLRFVTNDSQWPLIPYMACKFPSRSSKSPFLYSEFATNTTEEVSVARDKPNQLFALHTIMVHEQCTMKKKSMIASS